MTPIDFRNVTYEQLRARLAGQRERAYSAWLAWGPGTTRGVAALAQWDLLSFRPRTTELVQLGLVCLADEQPHRGEGIYRARMLSEWSEWALTQREAMKDGQLLLKG